MADVLTCFPLVAAQLLYYCDATSGDIVDHLSGTCNYCLSLWWIKACSKLYTFSPLHLKASMFRYWKPQCLDIEDTEDKLELVKMRLGSEMVFFHWEEKLFTFVWSRNVLRDCGRTVSVSGCCVAARKAMVCHGSVREWVWRSQTVWLFLSAPLVLAAVVCHPHSDTFGTNKTKCWNDKSIMSEWWVKVLFPLNWIFD